MVVYLLYRFLFQVKPGLIKESSNIGRYWAELWYLVPEQFSFIGVNFA